MLRSSVQACKLGVGSGYWAFHRTRNRCQWSPSFNFQIADVRRGKPRVLPQPAAGTASHFSALISPRLVRQRPRNMSVEGSPTAASAAKQEESSKKAVEVVLDEQRQRFQTPDGKAYLQYVIEPVNRYRTGKQVKGEDAKQVMLMQHTYVPAVFRGQGVAGRLCVAAFEHCKDKGLLVLPICSYISDTFLPRNPEWDNLVLRDSGTKAGL
ncbi:hypothetical protein R1sor_020628 [Riccia sorocarpa]|uniref:N-acetyltransferase domain-containing protein n=1 Tax=Riccia sorocarpa TaxID=122646 RepID=A0ABD3GEP9_9MARC